MGVCVKVRLAALARRWARSSSIRAPSARCSSLSRRRGHRPCASGAGAALLAPADRRHRADACGSMRSAGIAARDRSDAQLHVLDYWMALLATRRRRRARQLPCDRRADSCAPCSSAFAGVAMVLLQPAIQRDQFWGRLAGLMSSVIAAMAYHHQRVTALGRAGLPHLLLLARGRHLGALATP